MKDHISESKLREIVREIGATSGIAAPLILRNQVIGVLRLVMTNSGRTFSDDDMSLAQDVAHHGALAIEDARLYRAAQEAARARDELLAVVSHDLRNYLSTVRMSAEVLSKVISEMGEPKMSRLIDALLRAADRMMHLIESLRDATMIETGRLTIHPKKEDLGTLLGGTMRTLSPQAERQKLRLGLAIPKKLPPVRCDSARIDQVIANLVGNAIKVSREGSEILVAAEQQNGHVRVSVSDSGQGIAEQHLPWVFERHYTGGIEGRESTGLGLFIARGIVHAHGGNIGVESKVGVGSTFFFTLPIEAPHGHASSYRRGRLERS
jgi:signal transduction histidine kinase